MPERFRIGDKVQIRNAPYLSIYSGGIFSRYNLGGKYASIAVDEAQTIFISVPVEYIHKEEEL